MFENFKNMFKPAAQIEQERRNLQAQKENAIAEERAQAVKKEMQDEARRQGEILRRRQENAESARKITKIISAHERKLEEHVATARQYKHDPTDSKFQTAFAAVRNTQAVLHKARETQLGIALGAQKIEFGEMLHDYLTIRKNNIRIAELMGDTGAQLELEAELRMKEKEFENHLIQAGNASASWRDPLELPGAMSEEEAMRLIDGADEAATAKDLDDLASLGGFPARNSDQIRRTT